MSNDSRKFDEGLAIRLRDFWSLHIWLAAVFIIIPTVPYLQLKLRGLTGSWLVFFVWVFVVFILNINSVNKVLKVISRRKKEFVSLGAFCFIVLTYYLFVDTNPSAYKNMLDFFTMFLVLILDAYYLTINPKYRHSIFIIVALVLGIQAIVSIPYLLSTGVAISRQFSNGDLRAEMGVEQRLDIISHGVGGNSLYTSLPGIIIIGYAIADSVIGVLKIILYICLVSMAITVFMSGFLASMLLLVLGFLSLALALGRKIFTVKRLIMIFFIVIVGVFFYNNYLSNTRLLQPVELKIEAFSKSFSSKGISAESDVTGRTTLAARSLNTFFDNPIFGIGNPPMHSYQIVGEHMPWVDNLAYFGLIGFSPFLLFIYFLFKKNRVRFFSKKAFVDGNSKLYNKACLIAFCLYIMASFIGPLLTASGSYMMFLLWYASSGQLSLSKSR